MILPFEDYSFVSSQLRYLLVPMSVVPPLSPPFKPDGRTVVQVETMLSGAEVARKDLLKKLDEFNVARGQLDEVLTNANEVAGGLYGCMKSCYRTQPSVLVAIRGTPKNPRTPSATVDRMEALHARWLDLPPVPGTTDPFGFREFTPVTFETLKNDLKAKLKTHDGCDAKLKRELAAFRELVERLGQFASAALVQGRKIYRPGTPERALIDAVPTAPSTQAPAQAQITVAESPSFGAVRLVVEAEHATSFEIWRKGPADEEFVKVADVLKPGDYTDSGLDAGDYEFKAFGVNSRGEGPVSAVVTVTVEVETVPAQAEFTLAESPAPGAAHLEIVSDGATTFHILHKGPGMAQFALVANLSANGSVDYVSSNLAAGVHEFKARGLNAQGTGAESEVVVLEVEAQQAA